MVIILPVAHATGSGRVGFPSLNRILIVLALCVVAAKVLNGVARRPRLRLHSRV